jgi:2-polyprenyl-6-methoxyphenol hydroxylase-like FAD-dependent oxidoreductase
MIMSGTVPRTARIAISGGGLGGLTCARVLQRHGFDVTVFERETAVDTRWQGGTLDLHVPTGQAALRVAGLYERFIGLARPEGQEVREYHHRTGPCSSFPSGTRGRTSRASRCSETPPT